MMKLTQREAALLCKSTIALSVVALCVAALDSPMFEEPTSREPTIVPYQPKFAQVVATPAPEATQTPFVPFELDSNKHNEFMAEEEREMEEKRQGK